MFGLLNINKPTGVTSRDVVNHVQRLVRPIRVGHAGTLDPLATGVLVVCLGPATRLVPYVQQQSKRYLATFLLGRRSASDDVEEPVEVLSEATIPNREAIEASLARFRGAIRQRPPQFSAVKVNGRRAYELARTGAEVEIEERTVHIHELHLVAYSYPEFELDIHCGSGTYVRSLGRDVAQSLGTRAVMSALTRTAIGSFEIAQAIPLDRVSSETIQTEILPPTRAVAGLTHIHVSPDERQRLAHGQDIEREEHPAGEQLAAINDGNLVAILTPRRPGILRPLRNFPAL